MFYAWLCTWLQLDLWSADPVNWKPCKLCTLWYAVLQMPYPETIAWPDVHYIPHTICSQHAICDCIWPDLFTLLAAAPWDLPMDILHDCYGFPIHTQWLFAILQMLLGCPSVHMLCSGSKPSHITRLMTLPQRTVSVIKDTVNLKLLFALNEDGRYTYVQHEVPMCLMWAQ